MLIKFLLGVFFMLSLLVAFVLAPLQKPGNTNGASQTTSDNAGITTGRRLRLLSWNIGNGDLESETRAHNEDLSAVAQVIKNNDADAVALQELTGEDQLRLILSHLDRRYHGYVCNPGNADRTDAVLIKDSNARGSRLERIGGRITDADRGPRFNDVSSGGRFAAAASFRIQPNSPEVILVSAHADAFSSARRRGFIADVVDWTRGQDDHQLVFIAGDFNLEVGTRNKTNLFTDDANHDSESYAYLLKYFHDLGRDAGETSINDRRIDYIFGPDLVTVRLAKVLRGSAVGRMDHWPLLVEVEF